VAAQKQGIDDEINKIKGRKTNSYWPSGNQRFMANSIISKRVQHVGRTTPCSANISSPHSPDFSISLNPRLSLPPLIPTSMTNHTALPYPFNLVFLAASLSNSHDPYSFLTLPYLSSFSISPHLSLPKYPFTHHTPGPSLPDLHCILPHSRRSSIQSPDIAKKN
jgi:hypothetical protein